MSLYECILKKGFECDLGQVALMCDREEFTYLEFVEIVDSLAMQLEEAGIKRCAKVMIVVEDPLDFIFLLFAISKLNAICIPIYGKTGNEKLERIVNEYGINYVIMGQSLFGNDIFFACKSYNGDKDILIYKFEEEYDYFLNEIGLILFTSGTTSTPKAIMLSVENIKSNVCGISAYLKLKKEDRILLIKNLSHSSSIVGELFVGIQNGCTVILTRKLPTTPTILKMMERESISIFFAVPTVLQGILSYKKLEKIDFSRLRIINFYGAPMSRENIIKLIKCFPMTNIIYSYGLTEASPRVTYIEKQDLLIKTNSSGKPIIDVSIKIVNSDGKMVKPYEIGEIVVNGPNVMRGYYRDDMRTLETVKDGNLHTGDIGYIDETGYLFVKGRKDNMFISAGKNIYPEEIEGVLMSYEDIQDALVRCEVRQSGISHIYAFVVMVEGKQFESREIFKYCKKQLEDYKIPHRIMEVRKLEKTPSGKIVRNQSVGKF